jgi:hypothetical protein
MNQPPRRPLHPIAQALLSRVVEGAARASARAADALGEAIAEEAEEVLEQVAGKAIEIKDRLKSARTRTRRRP